MQLKQAEYKARGLTIKNKIAHYIRKSPQGYSVHNENSGSQNFIVKFEYDAKKDEVTKTTKSGKAEKKEIAFSFKQHAEMVKKQKRPISKSNKTASKQEASKDSQVD